MTFVRSDLPLFMNFDSSRKAKMKRATCRIYTFWDNRIVRVRGAEFSKTFTHGFGRTFLSPF